MTIPKLSFLAVTMLCAPFGCQQAEAVGIKTNSKYKHIYKRNLLLIKRNLYLIIFQKRFEIFDIKNRVIGENVAFQTHIHDNGTKFDIYLTLIKPLKAHDLLMSLKLKRKANNDTYYSKIFQLRRIEVCKFLANNQQTFFMQAFFKIPPAAIAPIQCPLKPGNYNLTNLSVEPNMYVNSLDPGNYRFFVEVAQLSSGVKLLDMQITVMCEN